MPDQTPDTTDPAPEATTQTALPDGITASDASPPDDDLEGSRLHGELFETFAASAAHTLEITIETGQPNPRANVYLAVRPPGKRGRRRFVCSLRPMSMAALLAFLTRAAERLADENRAFRQRDELERPRTSRRPNPSHRWGSTRVAPPAPRAVEGGAQELPAPPRCAGQARRHPAPDPLRVPGQPPASFLAMSGKVAP